ncbi:diphthamide biosynthesis enzyme Dph2, partial [Candidatus Micrarchaeota archaeon]|nr:diphthamide biosynthesis enzyme Dph2 [Candidatus Micrarchaeota archaeon]
MLKVDVKQAVSEIRKKKAKTVVLQIPEGLKGKAVELIELLEKKTKARIITVMDPVWGACDIADEEAKNFEADLIIHLGHSKYCDSKAKVTYIPLEYEIKEIQLDKLERILKNEKMKNIGLVCAIQFYNVMKEIEKILKKKRFNVLIEKGNSKSTVEGQILGCDVSAMEKIEKNVDGIVFVGDGIFHPLGAAVETEKKVLAFNPLNGEVRDFVEEKELYVRKRYGHIARAKNAKSFGILLSRKKGQFRKEIAFEAKKKIEKAGKKA